MYGVGGCSFPWVWSWSSSFYFQGVGSTFLATTVSFAFRTIGVTELTVTHDDMLARGCKRWNRWNLARQFFRYSVQVYARTQPRTEFRLLNISWQVLSIVPSWWVKALQKRCWCPLRDLVSCYAETFALICASFLSRNSCLSPLPLVLHLLFPFRSAQIPSGMT